MSKITIQLKPAMHPKEFLSKYEYKWQYDKFNKCYAFCNYLNNNIINIFEVGKNNDKYEIRLYTLIDGKIQVIVIWDSNIEDYNKYIEERSKFNNERIRDNYFLSVKLLSTINQVLIM